MTDKKHEKAAPKPEPKKLSPQEEAAAARKHSEGE